MVPALFSCPRTALRFQQLLEQQIKPLVFQQLRALCSREVLVEAWQEARLSLLEYLQKGKEVHFPRAFLKKLTYRKIVDYYQKKQKQAELPILEKSSSPVPPFEQKNFLHYLFQKAQLSPRDQALLLQHKAGYSDKELAQRFALRQGSVKVIRARALQALRYSLTTLTELKNPVAP